MVEKVTEIDVLCRPVDRTDDPIVVRVLIPKPGVVLLNDDEVVEALGFSYIPEITLLSKILAHGWVKKGYIPTYQGGTLPAWKLVRD
jgi:hypothetical protein